MRFSVGGTSRIGYLVRLMTVYIGGFLAGLIIPQENGFAISLVEKLEDLVSILFLPLVSITVS